MGTIYLHDNLFYVQLSVTSAEEVIHFLAQQMLENEFVEPTFEQALLEREKIFPTGLPLASMGVAIPHTDPQHVKQATIAVAILEQPVLFKMMGNEEVDILTNIVFTLAINQPSEQIVLLEKLMELFQNEAKMDQLLHAKTKEQAKCIVEEALENS
ncbi:MAG: PTS sugar transporter subunit IIA [Solibacillus sp.]